MTHVSRSVASKPHPGFMVCMAEVHLAVEDIWPDGDAPETPTAADVVARMRESGHVGWVISEWNLVTEIEVFDNKTATIEVFR